MRTAPMPRSAGHRARAYLIALSILVPLLSLAGPRPLCAALPVGGDVLAAQMRANYEALTKAYTGRDRAAVAKLLAPGMTQTDLFGQTYGRAAYLKDLGQMLAQATGLRASFTPDVLGTPAGAGAGGAPVVVLARMDGSAAGMATFHRLEADTWVHTAAGWRLTRIVSLGEAISILGLPYRPEEPPDHGATRAALQARYDAFCKAYAAGDAAALGGMIPAAFVRADETGAHQDRDQVLAALRANLGDAGTTNRKAAFRLDHLRLRGKRAVVVGNLTVSAEPAGGAAQGWTRVLTERDAWEKTPEGWTLRTDMVLMSETTVGGQSQPPVLPGSTASPPPAGQP